MVASAFNNMILYVIGSLFVGVGLRRQSMMDLGLHNILYSYDIIQLMLWKDRFDKTFQQ